MIGRGRQEALEPGRPRSIRSRGQANLVTLAVALVALTTAAAVSVVVAGGALDGADRSPEQRRVATALAERLVADDAPLTDRPNVLNATALERLDADRLRSTYPVARGSAVRVTLDGETVAAAGDPAGGTTARRVVLVQDRRASTFEPAFDDPESPSVTLPRRTPRVWVWIDPDAARVETVRANGRVVLHDPGGLTGNHSVRVSRFETTTLSFETAGSLDRGDVRLTYLPARTRKAVLEVTVDG